MKNLFIVAALAMLSVFTASAQTIIPVKGAASHIGKKITTCDKVYGTKVENGTVYLYLGADGPHALLTVIIKSADRAKFKGNPGANFKGEDICVTGKITGNKGAPKVVVTSPKQIHAIMMDNPIKQKASFN